MKHRLADLAVGHAVYLGGYYGNYESGHGS